MKRANPVLRCSLILLTLVAAGSCWQVSAQVKQSDDKTLQELLDEVRLLRQALQTLQRMSVDTYRSQLLVDRVRVGHEDIRRLTASLNDTRDTIAKTQNTIPQFVERQKLLESQLQLEVDQQKRVELEFEIKRTKDAVEMYKSQIEPLKDRAQQLATELNATKAKVDELESRLDLLEQGIEADRQRLEKPSTSKAP
ncbi:MAG TPA: hypothetical protein VNG71_19535 [Pyrinomonadaceae bacterium]|nr:hypothetical protein [Pyrinomonadaceae bacterium]